MLARLSNPVISQVSVQKARLSLIGKRISIEVTHQLVLNFTKKAFRQSENQKYSGFFNHNNSGLNYLCLAEKAYNSKYPDQINYNFSFLA